MRTSYSFAKADGDHLSPAYVVANLSQVGVNQISFEFYNDAALTTPSTGMTGTLTVYQKPSPNSVFTQVTGSTVNVASAAPIQFTGVLEQLKVTTASLANTSYVNVIIDTSRSI